MVDHVLLRELGVEERQVDQELAEVLGEGDAVQRRGTVLEGTVGNFQPGAIMEGRVIVDGHRVDKAGHQVARDALIRMKPGRGAFVSRGGDKLEHALRAFQLNVQDLVCLDVGASTGGFTHCLLKNNASKVYAVDVGYGQMDPLIRSLPERFQSSRSGAASLIL